MIAAASARPASAAPVSWGDVYASGGIWCDAFRPGVKSPDQDGDCIVAENDLEYVESRIGTDDFCADLDGSGLVGPEDVAIVQETLGDHCSRITGLEPGGEAGSPSLSIHPNPCREAAWIRLKLPQDPAATIRVFDAAGGRLLKAPLLIGR